MQQCKKLSDRIFSTELIQKRQSSMYRIKKSFKRNTILRNIEKQITKDGKIVKAQFQNEIDEMNEKEARSYAQMIANYNEVIYGSNSRLQRDNINSMGMIIHRSPFSTASAVLLKLKTKQDESKREKISSACLNCSNQNGAKLIKETSSSRYYSQYNGSKNSMGHELQRSSSYAAMIERYSNAMKLGNDYYNWAGSLVPKRNVSTNLEQIPVSVDAKKPEQPDLPNLVEDETTKVKDEQDQWLTKVDDVIKNLKRVTEKTESMDEKKKEMATNAQVNERAKWLDRVMNAHKKSIEERKLERELANARPSVDSANQKNELLETSEMWKTMLSKNSKQPPRFPFEKPSSPIIDYIKRGPVSSGSPPTNTTGSTSKTPSHTPTSVITGTTKEPQIELRMTPSQNESVVSINVDEQAAKTVGSSAKEQLSVTIFSKKNTTGKMEMNRSSHNTDFGSMQISISENTIPVKQIEFSINGKPVSELKSIVARADKLDVFSSMDKVEIRIPSKDRATMLKEQSKTSITASSKPVLNLQIAAKFNEPRVQQPRGADIKDTPSPVSPASPSPPLPPPVKPPRPQNLFDTIDIKKAGTMKEEARKDEPSIKGLDTLDMIDVNKPENASTPPPTHHQIETLSVPSIHGSVPKEENVLTVRNIPLNLNPNEAIFQKGSNVPQENSPSQLPPTMNKENLSNNNEHQENKIPSSVIPWWSSEDSFKNIKRKDNNPSRNTAVSLDGTLPLVQTEDDRALQKESISSDITSTDKHDSIDSKRVNNPGDTKKPSIVETEPIINYLEKSGNRCASIKLEGAKASPRSAKNSGRIVKRSKLRVKHKNYVRRKAPLPVKKESEASTSICSVCSPKIMKYVQVVPREAKMETRSETRATLVDQGQKTGHEVDKLKLNEEKKTETKIVKSVMLVGDDTHVEKANVHNSNTVFKKENALGKSSANKSADVSAKSSPSSSKVDYDGKKESRQGTEGTTAKDQADKLVDEDQRIKEILKSMKPIEKRKDGTLIDYGVTVPSRKPSSNVANVSNATGIKTDVLSKQSVSTSSEKIVEPTKIFSTKKQATLMEPRNVVGQLKVMEAERIYSVKKVTKLDDSKVEIKKPELKVQGEEAANQNKGKECLVNMKGDESRYDTMNLEAQKGANLPNLKQAGETTSGVNLLMEKITVTGSAPLKGTLSDHEKLKKFKEVNDTTDVKSSLLTNKSENVFPASSTSSQNSESKDILKLTDEKKTSMKLLNVAVTSSPKIEDKRTDKVDIFPLMGTINPANPETKSNTEKNDVSLMKEYAIPLKKNANNTGIAPLEGTIQHSNNIANVNEKKANSNEGKNDLPKMDILKKPSDGGGGNTGSNPVPVGPSGVMQSNIYTPTECKKRNWNYNEYNEEYMATYNEMKRPEKDMLYSSWLQRFKDRFNNKII